MKNRYRGINPHLNSLLQTPGGDDQPSLWSAFHASHINHIADFLNQTLPPNYIALTEQSLQVRGFEEGGNIFVDRPRPDVSIFQKSPSTSSASQSAASQPTWQANMIEVLDPEDFLTSVVIREVSHQPAPGQTVTRIELLSPSNKPFHANYSAYRARRLETLHSHIPLIEIDYLHETLSPIPGLPASPDHLESHAYTIAVSDPRPDWEQGHIDIYGFDVNRPVVTVPIPLAGNEKLVFGFDQPYQVSFESRRWYMMIDETQEPARFDTYSPADQARIRQRMIEISHEIED